MFQVEIRSHRAWFWVYRTHNEDAATAFITRQTQSGDRRTYRIVRITLEQGGY